MKPLFSSALRDDNDAGDIAYVSLAVVTGLLVFTVLNLVGLVWVDWATCKPHEILPTKDMPNIPITIISCKPDTLIFMQAFGLAAGAFSTALLALAAYMAATRRPVGTSSQSTTTTTSIVAPAAPAVPAVVQPQAEPLKVDVVHIPS